VRAIEEATISFQSPLRTRRGRIARGSQLHDELTLRQLLTWVRDPPDLGVVLVDADGENGRRAMISGWVAGLSLDLAIGVAAQEFEAWLIADVVAVSRVLGVAVQQPPDPESMKPREAKKWLSDRIEEVGADSRSVRMQVASELDLDRLKGVCRSFEQFLGELRGERR